MDYQQGIDFLYGLQTFGIKLGLENIRSLLANLGSPQVGLRCVHVAGTNGKGSVSAFLAETLHLSGLKVGLYTSPHLHCFTERIRIDGEPVSRQFMAELATEVREASQGIAVTFFEAATAMGLLAFRRQAVDIAIIETGLGGRLDATNIIQPILTLITPISHDHQEHLGESLADIAGEKAGILKPGIPVVIGRQTATASRVLLSTAEKCAAQVCLAQRDYSWQGEHMDFTLVWRDQILSGLQCGLAGQHQLDNLAQALAGAMTLRTLGWSIPDQAVRQAGQSARWPGRLEWWSGPVDVLLDAAHNAAGVACLASYLSESNDARLTFLIGLSRGRKPAEVLKPLAGVAADVYAVPVPAGESVDPAELVAWAESCGIGAYEYPSPAAGLQAAITDLRPGSPLVVCGSLFLVAAVREILVAGPFQHVAAQAFTKRLLPETMALK